MLTLSQETTTTTTMTQDSCKDSGLHDDVFHTPPEQPSLPTSQLRSADFHHCTIDEAVLEIDNEIESLAFVDFSEYAEAADSMDLSDDGELGFAQVKVKNTEHDDIEERVEIDDESLEGICEAEKLPCSETCEGEKTDESGDKQPETHELPSSIDACLENKAKENENGKCGRFVFDVLNLKAIVKDISEDESPEHVSFLELAKARGVNFPRQRWRRQNDDMTTTEEA